MAASIAISAAGCNRHPDTSQNQGVTEPKPDRTTLPFGVHPRSAGISPSPSFVPAVHSVPAGTPLVVRLTTTLSSARAQTGDTFRAILDEAVLASGKLAIRAGTPVTGTVVASRASHDGRSRGYLRLKITSAEISGAKVPLESSSLFAASPAGNTRRGDSAGNSAAPAAEKRLVFSRYRDVKFAAQQRLTFQLTSPMSIP